MLLRSAYRRTIRREPKDSSASRCQFEAHFRIGPRRAAVTGSLLLRINDRGRDEVVGFDERWNFEDFDWVKQWVAPPRAYLRKFNNRVYFNQHLRNEAGAFYRLMPTDKRGAAPQRVISALYEIQQFCRGINYYGASQFTNPTLCPTSFEIDEDGDLTVDDPYTDHVQFLSDLFELKTESADQYQSFINLVGKKGLGLIERITWKSIKFSSQNYEVRSGGRLVKKRRERRLIVPTIHIGASTLSFNQLSEGTFRTLALLFYIITDRSRLLLLEEPEVCVHHGLLNSVIEVVRNFSHSKQIVFSTHSEAVLDRLKPEQIRLIENSSRQGTIAKPLDKALSDRSYMALKAYLEDTGSLGEYWRTTGFRP